jgi:chloride channel protein, CIC family
MLAQHFHQGISMDGHDSQSGALSHPLRWFPEFAALSQKRFRTQGRLYGAAILVGVVAGLGAVVFAIACQAVSYVALSAGAGYRQGAPAGEAGLRWLKQHEPDGLLNPWLLLIIPPLGGLVSGLIVFRLAPEAEGHGTDAVIDAYHNKQGYIRPRVPIVKIVASAVTIGSGGSGGREGPIAQIGAGFGSFLSRLLGLRPAERRVLLAAGMGAGVAAIFRAPLAGALFASEVLYSSSEFEPEVIIPAGIASVVSYCTFGAFFGWDPLFQTPPLHFDNPWQLGPYMLLALFMSLLAMLYTRTFYGTAHWFRSLRLPNYLKPAIGAFLSAVIGVGLYGLFGGNTQVLSVLSFGYGILQDGMTDGAGISALVLIAVAFGKIATTSLTIGSGGSGGVFGPSMVIGGCGGGALGIFFHRFWPELAPNPASFVIVGMAGFFAAAAKTPFSTLIIVSEMTGNYELLLPALWVCALAFLLSDEQSLYSSQVESRSRSPAHQGAYVRDVLTGLTVRQFLTPEVDGSLLHPNDSFATVIERLSESTYPVVPVVDADQRLLGVVILEEVHLASRSPNVQPWVLAADLMRSTVQPLQPDDRLDRAQELFAENDLLALPVVDNLKDRRVLGMVRRIDIAKTYLRRLHGNPTSQNSPPV